jgi:hypothetical protein
MWRVQTMKIDDECIKQFRRYYSEITTYKRDVNAFAKECGYKWFTDVPRDDLPTFIEMFLEARSKDLKWVGFWTGPFMT